MKIGPLNIRWERRSTLANPDKWLIDWFSGGGKATSGVTVNETTALNATAVFSAVDILSRTLASLPLPVYRRLQGGGKERATNHPLYSILHDLPNREMTSFELRQALMGHLALWGNAFAEIERDNAGRVIALWPLRPDRMTVMRDEQGLLYVYRIVKTGQEVALRQRNVMHLRGLSSDGVIGYSPIRLAREAIGLALATEEFGARFFGNGSRPGGVLQHPGKLSEEAAKRLKKSWEEMHQGLSQAHRVAILEEGMTWQQVGIPPEDAQFLECVVPGTMISMANGTRKPVEDLRPGDAVIGWDDGPITARVKHVGKPPLKPLVRLTTARGRTLTATVDHPCLAKAAMRTPGGRHDDSPPNWVPAGELQPGNYIRVGLGHPGVPSTLDEETAWFLGAMVGDGYVRSGGCSFSNNDPAVIERMRQYLANVGGSLTKNSSREYDWDILTGGLGRSGSVIRRLLNRSGLVGQSSHTKRVPEMVLTGGPDAWRGFLAGYLDTDGSVRPAKGNGQPGVYWSSVNRGLLEDCQHLLAMLGIQSAIYLMKPGGKQRVLNNDVNAATQWGLYVTGHDQLKRLAKELNLAHTEKRSRLAEYHELPDSKYCDENWLYDRVTKVELLPPGETVGVEIEGVHTHITAGLVTHNTRKFQVTEIARIFHVPPHMLADLERSTFSNIEHQGIEFVVHTMRPWLVCWEQAIKRDLFLPNERNTYFAEFLVDGLLRGDIKSRYEAYAVGRQNGWLSADDIRELENMNPLPDGQGKVYLIPLNMIPASSAGQPLEKEPEGEGGSRSERAAVDFMEQRAQKVAMNRWKLAQSFKRLFADAGARIVKREVNDLKRALKKYLSQRDAQQFQDWLEEYYREHPEFIAQQMLPVLISYAEAVQAAVADEIGIEVKMTPELEEFVRAYEETFATRYVISSKRQLLQLLREAQEAAEDPIPIIEERLDEWIEKRPEKIAMRESNQANNAVALAVYKMVGIRKKHWVAVGKSCPYCTHLNGKVIHIDGDFIRAGEDFKPDGVDVPLKPRSRVGNPPAHAGCDCFIVAQ